MIKISRSDTCLSVGCNGTKYLKVFKLYTNYEHQHAKCLLALDAFFKIDFFVHKYNQELQANQLPMSQSAQAYSMELANQLTKITMEKFFKEIHSRFYPDQDVSFMEYFLELTQKEGEFVVPHNKLIDYGIVTSTRSSNILDKLEQLNLKKDKDYLLLDVQQQVKSGTKHLKVYHLTPEAFKKCLMRAQRRANQKVDPTIYCDYYLLLEKVFKLYTDYERQYAKCLLALKDDKIDSLNAKVDQQSLEIRQLLTRTDHIIVQNDQQSIVLKQQSVTLEQQSFEIQQLTHKIDTLFEYLLSFAHMTIPTWIGSSVLKKQYDTLATNKTTSYALKHLKVMFMVAFFEPIDDITQTVEIDGVTYTYVARTSMRIYFCCTNFADVRARIKGLYKKYTDGPNPMYMCQPLVITLISCEINMERIILENTKIFPVESSAKWNSKHKCFDLLVPAYDYSDVDTTFKIIYEKASTERFQGYQMRINEFTQSDNTKIDQKIIKYIDEADHEFYSSTKPFCQQYIDCYTKPVYDNNELVEYKFDTPGGKGIKRTDMNNKSMTNYTYSLTKIKCLLLDSSKVDHIQTMATQGILSKDDLPGLKAMAKFEQIDVSELHEPSESDSD